MLTRIGCEVIKSGCSVTCVLTGIGREITKQVALWPVLTRLGCEINLVLERNKPSGAMTGLPGYKFHSRSTNQVVLWRVQYAYQDWLWNKSCERGTNQVALWLDCQEINFMFDQPIRLFCDVYAYQDWLWSTCLSPASLLPVFGPIPAHRRTFFEVHE